MGGHGSSSQADGSVFRSTVPRIWPGRAMIVSTLKTWLSADCSLGYLNNPGKRRARTFLDARLHRRGRGLSARVAPRPDQFDVQIDQFHMNGLYMFEPAPFQPFVLLGVGATRFTPTGDLSTTTRFSIGLGGGVKWLWNDRHRPALGSGRWTPALCATPGTHFFCNEKDGSCYSTEANSYLGRYPLLSSFEFTTGLKPLRY